MLKELKEKCEQQLKENDSCYGCPCQEQCAAFRELQATIVGYCRAEMLVCSISDHFVDRFDMLIAKMGGEQNAGT